MQSDDELNSLAADWAHPGEQGPEDILSPHSSAHSGLTLPHHHDLIEKQFVPKSEEEAAQKKGSLKKPKKQTFMS